MSVHIRSRVVTVEGPRGKLTKDLSHINVTFGRPKKSVISIELHHGGRKAVATLRTVRTIINNMIIGVTKGFLYKMRYVYAHFPINVNVEKRENGQYEVEIRYAQGLSSPRWGCYSSRSFLTSVETSLVRRSSAACLPNPVWKSPSPLPSRMSSCSPGTRSRLCRRVLRIFSRSAESARRISERYVLGFEGPGL